MCVHVCVCVPAREAGDGLLMWIFVGGYVYKCVCVCMYVFSIYECMISMTFMCVDSGVVTPCGHMKACMHYVHTHTHRKMVQVK